MKDPLDQNPLYCAASALKGILRWEITVAAASVREKARTIEYSFSIEFIALSSWALWPGSRNKANSRTSSGSPAPAALPIAPKAGPAPTAPVPGPAP